ncbi:MAG: RAD55 family ATPase [Methanobacteriaceae archaeon]|nr:RAD55 family ATPase [Methanobacteriaceae archaeon]
MSYNMGIRKISEVIPDGTNILISGDLFSGKDLFSKKFIMEGLKNGEACIYISTNESAEKILDDLTGSKLENFSIIDCVSSRFGATVELPFSEQIRYVESPVDLTMMMVATNEFMDLYKNQRDIGKIRIVLDSISTLLMYSSLRTIFKFLHVLTTRVKAEGAVSLILMEEGAHDEIEIKTIQQLMHGIISLNGQELTIKGFTNLKVHYKIENGEILI